MEDRNAYLLISLGEDESILDELKQVVKECKRLKVVLWDTHLIVN
jgi:HKD family nuclease